MSEYFTSSIAGKLICLDTAQLPTHLYECVSSLNSDIKTTDLRGYSSQGDLLLQIAKNYSFPDYFDANLDALYDVMCEEIETTKAGHQTWLIRSTSQQQKLLFPILDTLKDAFSTAENSYLTLLWWIDEPVTNK